MSKENIFTEEQLNEAIENAKQEWIEQELNPIIAERDELLQYKPKELSDEEKALQEKEQELFNKEVELELKSAGLEQFKDVIKVENEEELQETIKILTKIVNEIKMSTGYIPKDNLKDDEYSFYAKKGDTQGMIATKLSKLFK